MLLQMAQLVGHRTAEQEVAGSNPRPDHKPWSVGKIMLAVRLTFASVQMHASLDRSAVSVVSYTSSRETGGGRKRTHTPNKLRVGDVVPVL